MQKGDPCPKWASSAHCHPGVCLQTAELVGQIGTSAGVLHEWPWSPQGGVCTGFDLLKVRDNAACCGFSA